MSKEGQAEMKCIEQVETETRHSLFFKKFIVLFIFVYARSSFMRGLFSREGEQELLSSCAVQPFHVVASRAAEQFLGTPASVVVAPCL